MFLVSRLLHLRYVKIEMLNISQVCTLNAFAYTCLKSTFLEAIFIVGFEYKT